MKHFVRAKDGSWRQPKTGRRSPQCNGYVNWPFASDTLTKGYEGGMAVWLLAIDKWLPPSRRKYKWPICCTPSLHLANQEVFVNSYPAAPSDTVRKQLSSQRVLALDKLYKNANRYKDQRRFMEKVQAIEDGYSLKCRPLAGQFRWSEDQEYSHALLAGVLLGTCGTNFYLEDADGCENWFATVYDLSSRGQQLYCQFKDLYERFANVQICTFLDT